jgi:DNA-binding LytR/AlgR family response regulator
MTKKKTRLLVRKRDENIALKIEEIVFIYRDDLLILVVDKDEKKYLCDKHLSELENELDPTIFFRANRKYLININYIRSFKTFEKVKLEIFLNFPNSDHQIIVSQKTAPEFRKWVAGE